MRDCFVLMIIMDLANLREKELAELIVQSARLRKFLSNNWAILFVRIILINYSKEVSQ
jgi:hypothetical protein